MKHDEQIDAQHVRAFALEQAVRALGAFAAKDNVIALAAAYEDWIRWGRHHAPNHTNPIIHE